MVFPADVRVVEVPHENLSQELCEHEQELYTR